MNNKIENIKLIFENEDSVLIAYQFVDALYVSGVTEELSCISGFFKSYSKAKQITLYIKKEAGELETDFGKLTDANRNIFKLKNKIKERNIVQIEIGFANQKKKIYVPWGNDEFINQYQTLAENEKCFIILWKEN